MRPPKFIFGNTMLSFPLAVVAVLATSPLSIVAQQFQVDNGLVVEPGDPCYVKGSVLMVAGHPCLMYKTIDIPVDHKFEYYSAYCLDVPFDEIFIETWEDSESQPAAHSLPTPISEYLFPRVTNTTLGRSHEYYVFEDFGIVPSAYNMSNQLWNVTFKETVMWKGEPVYTIEHHCRIRGIDGAASSLTSGIVVIISGLMLYFSALTIAST